MPELFPRDYGLTPRSLENKYEPRPGAQHPGYPRAAWRAEVAATTPLQGYWDWVCTQLRDEANEMSADVATPGTPTWTEP